MYSSIVSSRGVTNLRVAKYMCLKGLTTIKIKHNKLDGSDHKLVSYIILLYILIPTYALSPFTTNVEQKTSAQFEMQNRFSSTNFMKKIGLT